MDGFFRSLSLRAESTRANGRKAIPDLSCKAEGGLKNYNFTQKQTSFLEAIFFYTNDLFKNIPAVKTLFGERSIKI